MIEKFALDTPYQLEEIIEAFTRLKALSLDATSEALTSYGNTASAFGKNILDFTSAVSSAVMLNFKSLRTFCIQTRVEGDNVKFTFQGITTTVGKSVQEIETYLKSIGLVNFSGAMKEQMDTMGGAMSNIEDAISKLIRSIGENGLNKALKDTFSQFNELLDSSDGAAGLLKGIMALLGGPAGLVMLVVYGLYKLIDSHNVAKRAANDHADTLAKLKEQMAETVKETNNLVTAQSKNQAIAEWSYKLKVAELNCTPKIGQ